ncbi:MAG: NAD-dependent epimerase/dehydratase family protein, partial [Microbacterium gubbeenense]
MTRIAVIGGTGYAGRHIISAAASQGHVVTSFSRSEPLEPVDGAEYRTADVTNSEVA